MSAVLTFFKQRGSKYADEFRGMTAFRGSPLNEWDYLSLDPQLREVGVKLAVREYVNASDLEAPYNSIVKNAICLDLRCGGEKSDQYPSKGELTSNAIKTWILSILQLKLPVAVVGPDTNNATSEPIDTGVDSIPVSVSNSGTSSTTNAKTTGTGVADPKNETVESPSPIEDDRGLLGLSMGLAGTLLIAAMAVAGAVGGALLADHDIEKEIESQRSRSILDENSDVEGEICLLSDDNSGSTRQIDFTRVEKELKEEERRTAREAKSRQKTGVRNPWEEAPPKAKKIATVQIQNSNSPNNKDDADPTIGF